MTIRTHLAVAFVALPAMVAAILIVEDREQKRVTSASVPSVAPPETVEAQRPTASADQTRPDEAATIAYAAMRDNVNPRPRLLLIEEWARAAPPGARLDLLGQALVDPDASVRERAQQLFDRQLQRY